MVTRRLLEIEKKFDKFDRKSSQHTSKAHYLINIRNDKIQQTTAEQNWKLSIHTSPSSPHSSDPKHKSPKTFPKTPRNNKSLDSTSAPRKNNSQLAENQICSRPRAVKNKAARSRKREREKPEESGILIYARSTGTRARGVGQQFTRLGLPRPSITRRAGRALLRGATLLRSAAPARGRSLYVQCTAIQRSRQACFSIATVVCTRSYQLESWLLRKGCRRFYGIFILYWGDAVGLKSFG